MSPDTLSGWTLAIGILSIPALIAVNAFFVAAEFAIVTIRKTRIRELIQKGKTTAAAVQKNVDTINLTLAAAQLGITLASIALGWIGEPALAALLARWLRWMGFPWPHMGSHTIAFATALLLISFLHVILGEQVPKMLALQRSEPIALWVAVPILLFEKIFHPFILFLNWTGMEVIKTFKLRPIPASAHSTEELKMLVAETHQAGILGKRETDLLKRVFELPNKKVRDVMVPKEQIAALELKTPSEQILDRIINETYTRLPVYDGSLDKIVGIVHSKDLLHLYFQKGLVILYDLMREPFFVSPELHISDLLGEFQRKRLHIAIVQSPANSCGTRCRASSPIGGPARKTLGLVTLEDILEEITGEIRDEHGFLNSSK